MQRYGLTALTCLLLLYASLFLDGAKFDEIIAEDGVIETVGAMGLFLSAVLFALCAASCRRLPERGPFFAYAALAALFFFGAGEEISWGQRILGWQTPEELMRINVQRETNLHNLAGMHGWLDMGRLFQIFAFSFTLLVPAVAKFAPAFRSRLERAVPVLPWGAGVLCLVNLGLSKGAQIIGEAGSYHALQTPLVQAVTELKETGYGVVFAFIALGELRRLVEQARAASLVLSAQPPHPARHRSYLAK